MGIRSLQHNKELPFLWCCIMEREVIIKVEHALDIIFLHMCHHVGKQANRHLSKHLVSMVINHIGGQRALCSKMFREIYRSLSGPSKTIWHDAMENGWSVVYSLFQGMKHGNCATASLWAVWCVSTEVALIPSVTPSSMTLCSDASTILSVLAHACMHPCDPPIYTLQNHF